MASFISGGRAGGLGEKARLAPIRGLTRAQREERGCRHCTETIYISKPPSRLWRGRAASTEGVRADLGIAA